MEIPTVSTDPTSEKTGTSESNNGEFVDATKEGGSIPFDDGEDNSVDESIRIEWSELRHEGSHTDSIAEKPCDLKIITLGEEEDICYEETIVLSPKLPPLPLELEEEIFSRIPDSIMVLFYVCREYHDIAVEHTSYKLRQKGGCLVYRDTDSGLFYSIPSLSPNASPREVRVPKYFKPDLVGNLGSNNGFLLMRKVSGKKMKLIVWNPFTYGFGILQPTKEHQFGYEAKLGIGCVAPLDLPNIGELMKINDQWNISIFDMKKQGWKTHQLPIDFNIKILSQFLVFCHGSFCWLYTEIGGCRGGVMTFHIAEERFADHDLPVPVSNKLKLELDGYGGNIILNDTESVYLYDLALHEWKTLFSLSEYDELGIGTPIKILSVLEGKPKIFFSTALSSMWMNRYFVFDWSTKELEYIDSRAEDMVICIPNLIALSNEDFFLPPYINNSDSFAGVLKDLKDLSDVGTSLDMKDDVVLILLRVLGDSDENIQRLGFKFAKEIISDPEKLAQFLLELVNGASTNEVFWDVFSRLEIPVEEKNLSLLIKHVRETLSRGLREKPDYCFPRVIRHILKIFTQGLENNDAGLKGQSALGIGDLIEYTSTEAISESAHEILRPLINLIGDQSNGEERAVLSILKRASDKVGIQHILDCLDDKIWAAIGMDDVCNTITDPDLELLVNHLLLRLKSPKAHVACWNALESVIRFAGSRLGDSTISRVIRQLGKLVLDPEDQVGQTTADRIIHFIAYTLNRW